MQPITILKNEEGSLVIIASLIILALLSIIGVAASKTANTEVTLAGNEIVYQRNFYLAEGAALEAADILQNTSNLQDNFPDWIDPLVGNTGYIDIDWANTEIADGIVPQTSASDPDDTSYAAVSEGIAKGASLGMSRPTVHSIGVFGHCQKGGISVIKVGYKTAY